MPSVIISEEAGKEFARLQKRSEKGNLEAKQLLDLINKGFAKLAKNAEVGKQISKKKWPKEYIRRYGISNLWKLNLDRYWRMIYTLRGNQAEIISFVIEVLDHKKYSKKFGYKK